VGGRDENLAKMRKTALQFNHCNDTQEIAKSFWSYSYGGLSQGYV
jgi:hypothetical protein